jgi:hypothetical protein
LKTAAQDSNGILPFDTQAKVPGIQMAGIQMVQVFHEKNKNCTT